MENQRVKFALQSGREGLCGVYLFLQGSMTVTASLSLCNQWGTEMLDDKALCNVQHSVNLPRYAEDFMIIFS